MEIASEMIALSYYVLFFLLKFIFVGDLGKGLDGLSSIHGKCNIFSSTTQLPNRHKAHPAFYVIGTGRSIPGDKAAGA
jgi:hypothetical protein